MEAISWTSSYSSFFSVPATDAVLCRLAVSALHVFDDGEDTQQSLCHKRCMNKHLSFYGRHEIMRMTLLLVCLWFPLVCISTVWCEGNNWRKDESKRWVQSTCKGNEQLSWVVLHFTRPDVLKTSGITERKSNVKIYQHCLKNCGKSNIFFSTA